MSFTAVMERHYYLAKMFFQRLTKFLLDLQNRKSHSAFVLFLQISNNSSLINESNCETALMDSFEASSPTSFKLQKIQRCPSVVMLEKEE